MKKSLIVTLILALAMLVFVIIHNVQIVDVKYNIEYTEEILYGDASSVQGLHFQIPNNFTYIGWLTEGSVDGKLQCKTQYMSQADLFNMLIEEHVPNQDVIKEIILYRPLKDSFTCDLDETMFDAPAYDKMFKSLAEDVAIGQTKEFEVKLSDYCKYYDLKADVVCSNVYVNSVWSEMLASLIQVEVGEDVIMKGKITGYENTLSMSGPTKAYQYEYELVGGIFPYVRVMCFENAGFFYMDFYDNAGNRLTEAEYQPRLFRLDWTITGIQNPNTLDFNIPKYILEEETQLISGNILEICKSDDLFILAEEKDELFFHRMNPSSREVEKMKICNLDSQIQNVYMEGSEQGIFLVFETMDGLNIYYMENDGAELRPYIYADYEKNDCLKYFESYISNNGAEGDYKKIAYVYQDKKLAMLWRKDENSYNLLVVHEDNVVYASVLHSNFKEGLDKENVKPLKIWFE